MNLFRRTAEEPGPFSHYVQKYQPCLWMRDGTRVLLELPFPGRIFWETLDEARREIELRISGANDFVDMGMQFVRISEIVRYGVESSIMNITYKTAKDIPL